jgi:tripartite-type tricarboxylate transporter receptor subunit TctC
VIARLNEGVRAVMQDPEVVTAIAQAGAVPATGTPEAMAEAIGSTLDTYRAVVAARGIKLQ